MKMELTPKEKAQELIGKCFDAFINDEDEHYTETAWRLSKQCALIAIDEILNEENHFIQTDAHFLYWEQVKEEIEKL